MTVTLHASCVAIRGRGVLLTGPSGAGKSDLALRLIDRGAILVGDDGLVIEARDGRLHARPGPNIEGQMEVRGLGIVDIAHSDNVPVALVVELTSDIQRLPEDSRERLILGVKVPLISIGAALASAPSKVALALDRMGLRF